MATEKDTDVSYQELLLIEEQIKSASVVDDKFIETETKVSPCWDGYQQVGMKKGKNGKMVPNCVPVNIDLIFSNNCL